MINKQKVLSELEAILNSNIDPTMFPYQKGNSVRIGKYVVRSSKNGNKVFDCEQNIMIAETFSKTAAFALAKSLSKNTTETRTILDIDKSIQKWYNDCVFYNYSIKKTKDSVKKDIISVRYDIAKDEVGSAKKKLDKYIYRNG